MPTGHNDLCAGENKTIRNFEFLYETSFDQNILSDIYSDILSGMYSGIFLARLSARVEEERTTLMKSRDLRSRFHQRCPLLLFPGILFGIYSDILAGICIWHIF